MIRYPVGRWRYFPEMFLRGFPIVDVTTIKEFEQKLNKPTDVEIEAIQRGLNEAGIVFIPENGGGVGVRLKFTASDTRRIAVLETEGGISALDDIP